MSTESSAVIGSSGQGGAEESTATDAAAKDIAPRSRYTPGELSLDVTFELLMNSRRRAVLSYLDDHPSTTLGTLAEHVAAHENGKSVQQLTSTERKRVYISLYQCHLPKMNDAGVIDFDSDRGTVERNPLADHLATYLDRASGGEARVERPAWQYYYVVIALTGGGLLAAQLALLPSVAATVAVALALIAVLAGVALVHARHNSVAAT